MAPNCTRQSPPRTEEMYFRFYIDYADTSIRLAEQTESFTNSAATYYRTLNFARSPGVNGNCQRRKKHLTVQRAPTYVQHPIQTYFSVHHLIRRSASHLERWPRSAGPNAAKSCSLSCERSADLPASAALGIIVVRRGICQPSLRHTASPNFQFVVLGKGLSLGQR